MSAAGRALLGVLLVCACAESRSASEHRGSQPNASTAAAAAKPVSSSRADDRSGAPDSAQPSSPGWRWESALGIEVEVPADWAINDIDCNMTDAPTVAHARRGGRGCFTPELPSKQVIEFISYDGRAVPEPAAPEGLVVTPVVIGTEKAEGAEGRAKDGRFLGWLRVPRLQAALSMRVRDRATVQRVLASARIVDVAHNGCATSRAAMRPAPPARAKPLRGEWKGHHRIRMGDWRVIFKVVRPDLIIVRVAHRSTVYED